jgi:hypothetical protein
MLARILSMTEWKNEDDIKAELRVLTAELRKLREGLRNMVSPPPRPNPSREFLHRQAWPPPAQPAPPEVAADRPRPKKSRKKPR